MSIKKRKEKLTKKHKLVTVHCCMLHEKDETVKVMTEDGTYDPLKRKSNGIS